VHVQRLVSVLKMATMIEACTTEEQRSVVRFLGLKDSMQRVFIEMFPVYSGKCMSRKAVHSWIGNVSLMTKWLKRRCGEVAETMVK
jgi:hypothetical protein